MAIIELNPHAFEPSPTRSTNQSSVYALKPTRPFSGRYCRSTWPDQPLTRLACVRPGILLDGLSKATAQWRSALSEFKQMDFPATEHNRQLARRRPIFEEILVSEILCRIWTAAYEVTNLSLIHI